MEQEKIIEKFKEIKYNDGLILIEHIINNEYDDNLLKNIIISLSENKNKYTYEIYDYIIKNTIINYNICLSGSHLPDWYHLIHLCAEYGNITLLKHLIIKGININIKSIFHSNTSLMFASMYSNNTSSNEVVKLLLEYCADINLQNNTGETALMLASRNSNYTSSIETVKLLLENGADVNLKNKDGETALIQASMLSNNTSSNETVKLLLEYGADPNLQNKYGKTAYDLASANKYKNLIKSYMKD